LRFNPSGRDGSHPATRRFPSTRPIRRCSRRGTSWSPHHLHSLWGATSIFITENGCGASDVRADDGNVYDTDRVMFLRAHLRELQRATADGVPVDGYFLWSAQDNFEWMDGFGNRFGLIYVDFETQQRIPKLSASWFRESARRNAVA
jgi:beta-glucosidase